MINFREKVSIIDIIQKEAACTMKEKKETKKQKIRRLLRHMEKAFILCSLSVLIIAAVVHGISMQKQQKVYDKQMKQLQQEVKEEKKRAKEIEDYKKYIQTDEYIENMARDKLGMAKKDEILFKAQK